MREGSLEKEFSPSQWRRIWEELCLLQKIFDFVDGNGAFWCICALFFYLQIPNRYTTWTTKKHCWSISLSRWCGQIWNTVLLLCLMSCAINGRSGHHDTFTCMSNCKELNYIKVVMLPSLLSLLCSCAYMQKVCLYKTLNSAVFQHTEHREVTRIGILTNQPSQSVCTSIDAPQRKFLFCPIGVGGTKWLFGFKNIS